MSKKLRDEKVVTEGKDNNDFMEALRKASEALLWTPCTQPPCGGCPLRIPPGYPGAGECLSAFVTNVAEDKGAFSEER